MPRWLLNEPPATRQTRHSAAGATSGTRISGALVGGGEVSDFEVIP